MKWELNIIQDNHVLSLHQFFLMVKSNLPEMTLLIEYF